MNNKINEALLLSNYSLRDIAGQYEVSKSALQRHKDEHIPTGLVQAKEAKEICQAEVILKKLISLETDAARITKLAEESNDLKTALRGIREQSRLIEILAKMEGQIRPSQIDLTVNNLALLKIYDRLSRKVEEINETD
jgi:predicted DNA-binding protein YlxM (UPF0122 family)